ncbi:MAG TPA: NADH-quinone oxidoreductase subunit L [Acidimicrobiales bacterium]|nr:NADH-quinone oxidoreductase subunit L [Acidimicrobiales bacterium]
MLDAAYLIPAFPILGFVVLLCVGSKLKEPQAGVVGTLASGAAFLAALVTFVGLLGEDSHQRSVTKVVFEWIPSLDVNVAFLIDPLSMTMVLFVTGVGTLIHLFSIGYMHGDLRFSRFFLYLNLFLASMLLLVLGDSFLVMFLGWEGVGACSYLLISFWFERDSASTAAKKAFVANRVGDVGLMIAMFVIFSKVGSLTFSTVFESVEEGVFSKSVATAILLLLFLGACGKSAQLPLYVWLPDAMEGPTPVSALIHAATMVTAGVYLLVRVNPFVGVDASAMTVVAIVGAATALYAALIATSQDDIKKVLAYSTISQLGYMFLAVGSRAYVAAIFHMVTHAFFKALMFLGSGSVIHGMHDEQDMKRMGALRKLMPITALTFLAGWLAIAGIPPFAGFWSKDEILLSALESFDGPLGVALYAVGLLTALLTAYYMTRQIQLVFFGKARYGETNSGHAQAEGHKEEEGQLTTPEPVADNGHGDHGGHGATGLPHESPPTMTIPLVVLGVLAVVGWVINAPVLLNYPLEHWLEPVIEAGKPLHLEGVSSATKVLFSAIATAAGVLGIALGLRIWRRGPDQPAFEPKLLRRGFGYDHVLAALFGGPGRKAADAAAFKVDAGIIDGAVNGVATLVRTGGGQLRRLQSGYVRSYALGITTGTVLLLAYFVQRGR